MPIDMKIDSIETKLSTSDPAEFNSPLFIARIVAQVRAELIREREEEERRAMDKRGIRGSDSGR